VRLTYPGAVQPAPAAALADASRLLGVPLADGALVDMALRHWRQEPGRAARSVVSRAARVVAAVEELQGVSVTGAWVAGTGLAAVIPHAERGTS
jgi:oxygen-dependent protoporphyrinogen oxidase